MDSVSKTDKISNLGPLSSSSQIAVEEPAKQRNGREYDLVPRPSEDKRDPLNWSMSKKITLFSVMCFATFCGTSSAVANVLATTVQAEDWQVTPAQAAYSLSGNLSGIIVCPFLMLPLVQALGVMSCAFWSQIALTFIGIWSAVATGPEGYNSFVASRTIAGLFSVTAQIFTTGVISDIFFVHQRGRAFAIYSTIYILATISGPTFSGFAVQYVSWPYIFWWTVAANGAASVLIFIFGDDTSWDRENGKPVAEQSGSWLMKRFILFFPGYRVVAPGRRSRISSSFKALGLISFSPVTVLCGIYCLIAFGWFIMASVQVPILLQTSESLGRFGFNPQKAATFYFFAWVGALAGVGYGMLLNDGIPLFLQRRNNGVRRPEYHLHTTWIPGIIGPIGAGLFGATAYYRLHYMLLAVSNAFICFSATACIPPTVNYIIETFKSYPQEVGAALGTWRVTFSMAIPFFYVPWVERVTVRWVWATAAFTNIFGNFLILIVVLKGPLLRSWSLLPDQSNAEPTRDEKGDTDV